MPDSLPPTVVTESPFRLLAAGIDTDPLLAEIDEHPDLWDAFTFRKEGEGSPHARMSDIWLRYNDVRPYLARGSYEGFNDPHIPVNYPGWYALPQVRNMVLIVAATYGAEMIGGVLITRIPAGEQVAPHVDRGWHVDYYDKVYLQLLSAPGQRFVAGEHSFDPQPGDLYWFDNTVEHAVYNESEVDRLTLIICLRTPAFGRLT